MAKSKSGMSQSQLNHHANQLNPNNPLCTDRLNNHSNQLNPNNPAFYNDNEGDLIGGASLNSMKIKKVK